MGGLPDNDSLSGNPILERHTQSQHPRPAGRHMRASRKTGSVNLPGEGGLTGILAR